MARLVFLERRRLASHSPHIILIGGDGGLSGVPRHILALCQALADHARITVLSAPCQGGYQEIKRHGVEHIPLPGLVSSVSPLTWRRGKASLAAYLRAQRPDLVWAHARMPVLYLRQLLHAGQWRPTASCRVALTYHGLPFGPGHRFGTDLISKYLETRLLAASPPLDLIFLTQTQRKTMQKVIGHAGTHHRYHILGNASYLGAPPPPVARTDTMRHLVMTGRAGWQKNYSAALKLMRHMPKDITLTLCGAGTQSDRFAARMRALAGPAAQRIIARGSVEDIRPILAAADGYMLLSRYEGQPIGALEASEYGLPLILADFAGSDELKAEHPMALSLEGSLSQQAQAIDQVLDRFLADRAAIASRIKAFWAARYTPQHFADAARALVLNEFGLARPKGGA